MQIYVSRNTTQYGPYSLDQLRNYVEAGNFTISDLACFDGQNWVTVAQVPGLMSTPQKSRMPPPPQPVQVNVAAVPNPGKKNSCMGGCLILFVISLIGGVASSTCGGNLDSDSSEPVEKVYHDKLTAWVMTKEFVEKRLKSPSSADWGWQSYSDRVSHLGDGRYKVKAWVDSQNSFGAQIRTNFVAIVSWQGGDSWRLESLDL
jgi:hypothetical protein